MGTNRRRDRAVSTASRCDDTASRCKVDELWIGDSPAVTRGSWFWPAGGAVASTGVVVVGGLAHEEQTMALGLVALARRLAEGGTPALLIDLAGTAQGSGSFRDDDITERWHGDVRRGVRQVRERGLSHVVVVGVRLGALVAAGATVEDSVDLLVMWSPVLSGRRHVRELQMMQATAVDGVEALLPGATVAGFNFPDHVLAHVKGLDAARLDGKPADEICLVDSRSRLDAIDPDHRLFAAVPTRRVVAEDTERWLFTDATVDPVPFDALDAVSAIIAGATASGRPDLDAVPRYTTDGRFRSHAFDHDGVTIRETFVRIAADGVEGGLMGVLAEPVSVPCDRDRAWLAVTSVGPGRIFVDLARREAAAGRVSLRFDLSGFGTSGRRRVDHADFYQPSASTDIAAAAELLAQMGHRHVTVVGFCAGAWAGLRHRAHPVVDGVVALNPQFAVRSRFVHRHVWPDLSPVKRAWARLGSTEPLLTVVARTERAWPVPSPAMRAAGRRAREGLAIHLVYAHGDLGLEYHERVADRPGGLGRDRRNLHVHLYPDLGHLPAGAAREQLLDDMHHLWASAV